MERLAKISYDLMKNVQNTSLIVRVLKVFKAAIHGRPYNNFESLLQAKASKAFASKLL